MTWREMCGGPYPEALLKNTFQGLILCFVMAGI
jgi:hypothetical protein